ncbi:hypothetical protein QNI19_21180 [Cytophagaceae bacterium DM2B3-1]|uniref:Uncharacterized protein n=2 Tax=Xanthocytophaga TaxID=3078918 RepID=A0AAE3QK74_9BACT|nr:MULTISPECIES: hypothetical protein [Xanthocytophaga]MDJ1466262.1 hypothetical protein [Xanthocytophaga flavus]MDJ1478933.1 hypothetical protein [Xanthocytophaga flavus]MDJ1495466.1 hypothetical protein [Xanthocytophaga flavus]MDJ1500382.1 hypothetical protein [Xanthocytophaga agilis]
MDLDLKKVFGSVLTVLGIVMVLFACVAFLSDGKAVLGLSVSKWESLVPFVVGFLFFMGGLSLIRQTSNNV